MFTKSPSFKTRLPGIPWATSSLTLIQVNPGKSYSPLGPDIAPVSSNMRPPRSSSSFVVTPGFVAARIASRISATIRPIVFNAS